MRAIAVKIFTTSRDAHNITYSFLSTLTVRFNFYKYIV